MAKKKSVLAQFLKSIKREPVSSQYKFNDNEVMNFKIKTSLTVGERASLIADIVDTMFATGEYNQALYWPIVRTWVLARLTDIHLEDAANDKTPVVDIAMQLWVETDIADQIESVFGSLEYCELMTDIKKAVQLEIEARKPLNRLLSLLSNFSDAGQNLTNEDVENMKSVFSKLAGVKQSDFVDSVIALQKDENEEAQNGLEKETDEP